MMLKRLAAAWAGRSFWLKLDRKYRINDGGLYVLLMPEDDRELNEQALRHIDEMIAFRRAKGAVILTDQPWVLEHAPGCSEKLVAIQRVSEAETDKLLSEKEKPIEGTTAVFFPFSMAVEFLETAGYFVGLRSGLCDIVSAAKCKKVILCEDGAVAFASSVFGYFSLEKMGLCEDVLEIAIDSESEDELLARILQEFGI